MTLLIDLNEALLQNLEVSPIDLAVAAEAALVANDRIDVVPDVTSVGVAAFKKDDEFVTGYYDIPVTDEEKENEEFLKQWRFVVLKPAVDPLPKYKDVEVNPYAETV